MTGWHLVFVPMLPWSILGAAGLAGALLLAFGVYRRAQGTMWRGVLLTAILIALGDPSLIREQRQPQRDVALIVKDVSLSESIGDRAAAAASDVRFLRQRMAAMGDLDVRTIEAGGPESDGLSDQGTRLFEAARRALADVPARRVAGIVLVTDGQVHDVPRPASELSISAPVHALLTGHRNEADRRLIIRQAPSFGLVGKTATFMVDVEDIGGDAAARSHYPAFARLTIRKDGGDPAISEVPVGEAVPLPVIIDHGGPSIFEFEVEPGPKELTLDNNRAVAVVNGVRDRLRVLLVSGEPHPGERTWRNLLKADPSVDLVHFTILRPPEKQDGTPIRELSLIAFPIRELFDVKLDQFDLVIFDRYNRRGVLPQTYLDNIARYVENGGALLEAAGPVESAAMTLYNSPLGAVLPAEPTGEVIERGFKPRITAMGARHPVTADLPGAPSEPDGEPRWGRWFRQLGSTPHRGVTVMSGFGGQPLLVLDRVGQGRVAQLLSDHMWLWTRGFEGGGPQAELLRRLAYWLMKEPDLEENDIRASVDGAHLTVTRRTLTPDAHPVTVTDPDGKSAPISLHAESGGREVAVLPIHESGLYRIGDGTRTALAAAGALNPVELGDVLTTPDQLKPIADATGGGVFWAGTGADLPDLRRVGRDGAAAGPGWLGLRANGDYIVTGSSQNSLVPAWAGLALTLGALVLAWRREGR